MFFQPNECVCFGGRCWGKFCPKKSNKPKKTVKRKINPKNKIRTWHPPKEGDSGKREE